MKRITLITMLLAFAIQASAYHWEVNPHQWAYSMTVAGVVALDGVEQTTASLEVGAFCGEECRGREMPIYVPELDRYLLFLDLYGENGDTLSFRIYDHDLGEALDLTCPNTMVFSENGAFGTLMVPYVFDFLSSYAITATANPEAGGTVDGAGTYLHGETAILTATANTGYTFINWTKDGEEVSTEATYTFTVTEASTFVANFELTAITQTVTLSAGWNWWSGCIELDGNSLQSLEDGLGTNGLMIKSQNDGYASYLAGFGWYGSLSGVNNESMYQVRAAAGCTLELTGPAVRPADHPITLVTGWNWIGYPSTVSIGIAEALSGITPQNGDMLKSQNDGYASYLEGFGWYGSLNTLQPGMGLMYKSNNASTVTLVYSGNGTRTDLMANQTTDNNHWQPNLNAYPDNMSVMAVIELDGEELASERYELATFANGECRGSARLLYVEPLNRYMAFLTVAGDEDAELYFGLYDTETGAVETQNFASLQYETNAVVGSFAEPYIVSFRSTTGVDEWAGNLQVFPNPVKRGQAVSLSLSAEGIGEVQVEIVNALGMVVETYGRASLQGITAPTMAGVYTLRITVEGNGTVFRKLVVKE
ncbi:MAG: T9SS type A sorting domain-containing protein [Bacteroidales bacterium]|nr:T9SS type A sorting domain-containing protein [Bacteroidales bacterium]